ncbi:hypothetical protein SAMN04487904_102402 [Actinopolyspora lacussalsi subsp. righensis]|uniref:Uncharacterized protein n=1 Tax=Actinopolyspora righensis TaxID=995060 RepID=A0A1I6YC05_9ACTN|nr:hypothetical protein SAMN04487904_102402 [Actinopolyspora righensis]
MEPNALVLRPIHDAPDRNGDIRFDTGRIEGTFGMGVREVTYSLRSGNEAGAAKPALYVEQRGDVPAPSWSGGRKAWLGGHATRLGGRVPPAATVPRNRVAHGLRTVRPTRVRFGRYVSLPVDTTARLGGRAGPS